MVGKAWRANGSRKLDDRSHCMCTREAEREEEKETDRHIDGEEEREQQVERLDMLKIYSG